MCVVLEVLLPAISLRIGRPHQPRTVEGEVTSHSTTPGDVHTRAGYHYSV